MSMRKLILELSFSEEEWGDYEDVCDELLLEDSGILEGLKRGIEVKVLNLEEASSK